MRIFIGVCKGLYDHLSLSIAKRRCTFEIVVKYKNCYVIKTPQII